jgi:NAD(P)-dependent dehydrogenase (short-subunit alcohol dehydrogenase family)
MDPCAPFRLTDRVAVVTGASSGLGIGFAEALAAAGANVVAAGRRVDALERTAALVETHGRKALSLQVDVTDPQQCEQVVARTMEVFGRIDVLVNGAGLVTAIPATRETPEEFDAVIRTNLHGAYWMAQSCGRVMQTGSSIINVTSVVGFTHIGVPQAAYASSKSALIGLTRDLAAQWSGRKGIRVNALAPGFINVGMTADAPPEMAAAQAHRIVLGRQGTANDLVGPLIFLASDASAYVTGTVLVVDGGVLT